MSEGTTPRDPAILIEREMKDSYLSYAMSVIVSRALPDVRDGLKPSQRRVLVAMEDLNLGPRAKFKKCAKIAGDTSGNYHPHGEGVVYPTLVRLAQNFNLRVPLVDGQGNFGSIDGDPPAAMRYTEARMTGASSLLLDDLGKETVDFVPNYDGSREEPTVLPSAFPNLLVNGCNGIAVGMATSIPPHNPREICEALKRLIDEPETEVEELMKIVPGPDFPTGGILCGQHGIRQAYATGRGNGVLRCRAECFQADKKTRAKIVVTEIPYQVNKATLIQSMAQLVKDGRINSIYDVVDHSDRDGMQIVIEMKKGEDPEVTLNQLYKYTQLQTTVSIINIALVNMRPQTLPLKEMMSEYLAHRRVVVHRRTAYLLRLAEERLHIVEGLRIALGNIDEVIATIRSADDARQAMSSLQTKFDLSEKQAEAIVNMRLRALTNLEVGKLEAEWKDLSEKIADYQDILARPVRIDAILTEDLDRVATAYPSPRLTEIGESVGEIEDEDLIADESTAVTLSHQGYLKRLPLDEYRSQGRGGMGVRGGEAREGDFIECLFTARTHDYLLFFTGSGKVHWLKVWKVPEMSRTAMGRAAVNLIKRFPEEDAIQAVIPVRDFSQASLLFVTAEGLVKRTALHDYRRPKAGGIIAIGLSEEDRLIDVAVVKDDDEVVLGTTQGRAIRFSVSNVRVMGRPAQGVRGIRLKEGDEVRGMAVVTEGETLLTACQNGFGKRTVFDDYPTQGRGGQGVLDIRTTERNGPVVGLRGVSEGGEVVYITSGGQVVRSPVTEIGVIGRNTQGVRLITLKDGDALMSVAPVVEESLEVGEEIPRESS
ncbi:MAG: DNA gyrase subunit A [Planctomycetota bacterium]|nr:DNA gyrase subunit A [Planctomycetota bacterium]